MANFIECNREQQYLLPPALRDWLPPKDLAWLIIDAVDAMDLSAFYKKYRAEGKGQAAFEPSIRVALFYMPTAWAFDHRGRLNGCVSGTLGFALLRRTRRRITRQSADFGRRTARH